METINNNAKDFLLKKISKYRDLEVNYETNVTAIVNIILDICDIRSVYGYIIKDESIMISIRKHLPLETANRKSDKLVFKQSDKPVRGNYWVDDEKPLLVIECKTHGNCSDNFKEEDVDQLATYMSSLKFPYGILISEYKASFYKGDYVGGLINIKSNGVVDDILTNIDDLLLYVKKACK